MLPRRLPAWLIVCLTVSALVPASASADSPGLPHSYTRMTADGRYIFVMLAPTRYRNPSDLDERALRRIRLIEAKYTISGLYRNDGSTEPLWTVDWYASRVFPFSDGIHLVRLGLWATSLQDPAVSFYAEGRLLRTYRIDELVDIPSLLSYSVSHFQWKEAGDIDEDDLTYTVDTKDGNQFVFDLRTGEMIYSRRTWRWVVAGFAIVVPAALFARVWWRMRRGRRRAEAQPA